MRPILSDTLAHRARKRIQRPAAYPGFRVRGDIAPIDDTEWCVYPISSGIRLPSRTDVARHAVPGRCQTLSFRDQLSRETCGIGSLDGGNSWPPGQKEQAHHSENGCGDEPNYSPPNQ